MIKDYTWSYKKENVPLPIKVEYVLKYGDLEEINNLIIDIGIDFCKNIWIKKIIPDNRFNRLNYFLARFIFNISTDRVEILKFLKQYQRKRFEGIDLNFLYNEFVKRRKLNY